MFSFASNHALTIDEKGRVVLPLALRKCIREQDREKVLQDGFMVRPSDRNEFLEMYPKEIYIKRVDELEARYALDDAAGQAYLRFFQSRSEPVEIDRQYRFTLPEKSAKALQLEGEVIFVGRGKTIEIWRKDRWEDWERANVEFRIPPASAPAQAQVR